MIIFFIGIEKKFLILLKIKQMFDKIKINKFIKRSLQKNKKNI